MPSHAPDNTPSTGARHILEETHHHMLKLAWNVQFLASVGADDFTFPVVEVCHSEVHLPRDHNDALDVATRIHDFWRL
jgi:hypothetical protein